jgi:hypothetical protein
MPQYLGSVRGPSIVEADRHRDHPAMADGMQRHGNESGPGLFYQPPALILRHARPDEDYVKARFLIDSAFAGCNHPITTVILAPAAIGHRVAPSG